MDKPLVKWEITLLDFLLTAIGHSLVFQMQLHVIMSNGYMKQEPRPHPQKIDVSSASTYGLKYLFG